MKILNELLYTKNHEWVRVEGDKAYIGVTDYAQDHLGSIVFVELPEEGDELEANDSIASVESVKAASDVYTPISGEVVQINEELEDDPGLLNKDAYKNWVAVINIGNKDELKGLLSPEDYEKVCKEA